MEGSLAVHELNYSAATASTQLLGTASTVAMSTEANVQVLTNKPLWCLITQFMDGWPFLVQRMYYHAPRSAACSKFLSRTQQGVLPHLAIFHGDHHVLSVLLELYMTMHYRAKPEFSFVHSLACAVRVGRLDTLQWLHARLPQHCDWQWGTSVLRDALQHNDVVLLDWVYEHVPREHLVVNADRQAKHASVEQIAWLHQRGFVFSPAALQHAVRRGRLNVVQYLHEHVEATRCASAMNRAATYAQFDVVTYLHRVGAQCTFKCMDSAARAGRLDIVQLLHKERAEGCTTRAMDYAARHGHLDVVRFLHEHRSEGGTTRAMDSAARHGHLDVVRFLHEHRSEGCTTRALDRAAEYGHLDVVRFLLEHRHEGGTTDAGFWATYAGHHHVLKLLLLRAPQLCLDTLLEDAAMGKCEQTLIVLCEHSKHGCLFEARARAHTWSREQHVKVLSQFISPKVASCSVVHHRAGDDARRCQLPKDCCESA